MRVGWLITGALVACSAAVVAVVMLLAGPALKLPGLSSSSGALASFQYVAGSDTENALVAPEGATVDFGPVSRGDNPVARLSGVKSDAPSNALPGIYLPLDDAFEKAASGQTVKVTVMARRAPESPGKAFAVAYSTAEVGNSGWHRFDLTDELTSYSFTYDVPRMAEGHGDFIGILPDPDGSDGAVDISEITAEAFTRGSLDKPEGTSTTSSATP